MKLVTMTRDIRPYQKGHDALLDDKVAERLVKTGDATLKSKPEEAARVPPPAKHIKTKGA